MSGPRMGTSQNSQMNGSRRPSNVNRVPSNEKPVCSQHDDLIKYICDSWNKVSQESTASSSVIFYTEQENNNLKDFQPFNLEAFWARRLVQNLQQSSHHS